MTEYAFDAVPRLLEGTAGATGEAFFSAFTSTAAHTFGIRHALIGRFVQERGEVEVLSWWDHDHHRDPVCYGIVGTPCAKVLAPAVFGISQGVQDCFPTDTFLVEEGIEAYLGVPMLDGEHRLRGLLSVMHDAPFGNLAGFEAALLLFADRAAAELNRIESAAALAEREARLSNILENMSDGVWELDADGVTTFANRQMERMLGLPPGGADGRSLYDFMTDEAKATAEQHVERRRRGIAESHSFTFRRPDGSAVWTRVDTTPLFDSDGAYRGALAVVKDLTHERAVEQRLADAQRLEGLELMASGIAHDFNNVLGAIRAHAGRIRRHESVPSVVDNSVEQIERAVEGAIGLTRRLRASAGAPTGELTEVNLGVLVMEVTGLLSATLPAGTTLSTDVDADAKIRGDRSGLEQVVLNLITNARDVLVRSGGGAIQVSVRRVDIDPRMLDRSRIAHELAPGPHVVLEVSDDGPGMDESVAARIFDPFFSTKGRERGLGLAIVRGMTKAHGAALLLDTAPGAGSRFAIVFP